jgi:hypothetical protein
VLKTDITPSKKNKKNQPTQETSTTAVKIICPSSCAPHMAKSKIKYCNNSIKIEKSYISTTSKVMGAQ